MRAAIAVLGLLCLAAGEPEYRVVDLLGPFARYAAEAADADAETRDRLWTERLEKHAPRFFDAVIYRGLEGEARTRYRADCIARFWKEMAPTAAAKAKAAPGLRRRIDAVVAAGRERLDDFRVETDFYVTYSFSFRGKVVKVDDRHVMALGMELLPLEGPELGITIAHELFHLHHFRTFDVRGAIYRTLWAEGLATYASAVLVPGHRMSTCLGFSGEKMNRCENLLPEMAKDLLAKMGENDAVAKRAYFGAEENDVGVPPEAGYYVGLRLVQTLAKDRSLDRLVRMSPKEVWPLVAAGLKHLAGED